MFPLNNKIMYVDQNSQFTYLETNFSKLTTMLVPTGYQVINGYAPSDVTESLATSLNLISQIKDLSYYGGICLAVVLTAIAVWLMWRRYRAIAVKEKEAELVIEDEYDEDEVSMTRSNLAH